MHALQDGEAAPSEGVTAALQEFDPRTALNRRAKISESAIAVKWASLRHPLNQHFQALMIMRYDGKSLGTEASDHVRNLRLMQDAAKCVMREEKYLDFKEDNFRESNSAW